MDQKTSTSVILFPPPPCTLVPRAEGLGRGSLHPCHHRRSEGGVQLPPVTRHI